MKDSTRKWLLDHAPNDVLIDVTMLEIKDEEKTMDTEMPKNTKCDKCNSERLRM